MTVLEGSGKGATSAKNNDKFRVLLNTINVLENRAKARRRALLMVRVLSDILLLFVGRNHEEDKRNDSRDKG